MSLVAAPSPVADAAPAREDLTECAWCCTRIGREASMGIMTGEFGLIGFVHSTGCAQSYWRTFIQSGSFRLVKVP